jgi:hypothetical protein
LVLVPYSKYQLVEEPFGLIDPLRVAELELIELAGLRLVVGAVAAEAAGAATASKSIARASVFFMVPRYPSAVRGP